MKLDANSTTPWLRDQLPIGDRQLLMRPFIMGLDEDDLEFQGFENQAPRVTGTLNFKNRLEELRALALAAGEPKDRVADPAFSQRIFTFTGSDESVDRYGCRVLVDGTFRGKKYGQGWVLDNYLRAPRFMPFHEYSEIPVGRSLDTWADKKGNRKRLRFAILMDEGTAAGGASDLAPKLTRAYKSRLMDSVSVGWWPTEVYKPTEDERKTWGLTAYGILFATNDLWELSAVSIPGNPNARLENGVPESMTERYTKLADLFKEELPDFSGQLLDALTTHRTMVEVPKPEVVIEEPEAVDTTTATTPVQGLDVSAVLLRLEALSDRVEAVYANQEKLLALRAQRQDRGPSVFDKILQVTDEVTKTMESIRKT